MSTSIKPISADELETGSHRAEDRSPIESQLEIVVAGQREDVGRSVHENTIPGWSVNASASGLCFRCGLELLDERPLIRFLKGNSNDFAEYEVRHSRLVSEGVWEYGATLRRKGRLDGQQPGRGLTYRLSDKEFGSLFEMSALDPADALPRPLETVRSACPSPSPVRTTPAVAPIGKAEPTPAVPIDPGLTQPSAIPRTASESPGKASESTCLWAIISVGIAVVLSTGHIWGATWVTRYSSFALAIGSIATIEWIRSKLRQHRRQAAAALAFVKAQAPAHTTRR